MNLAALAELLPGVSPPQEIYCRLVNKQYASEIDEIIHSIRYSGRYNPAGEFPVLYLSANVDCAFREKLKQVHGSRRNLQPQIGGSFQVKLRCLDLLDAENLKQLGLSREALTRPDDYTTTQQLAREARRVGFDGIIAPSAVGIDCHTLVVFKDKLNPPSACKLQPNSVKKVTFR